MTIAVNYTIQPESVLLNIVQIRVADLDRRLSSLMSDEDRVRWPLEERLDLPDFLADQYREIIENGATTVVSANATGAEDMTVAKLLTITHSVANVADTNRLQGIDIEVVH
jgi:hypothetical protein